MEMQLRRPNREPPPVLLKVRIPGRVAEKLELYRALYREQYGEEIRVELLASESLGQFLESEPALRRRSRERRADKASDVLRSSADPGRRPEEP